MSQSQGLTISYYYVGFPSNIEHINLNILADPLGMHAHLLGKIVFIFMQFWEKFQNNWLVPLPLGLMPDCLRNPGSATA